MFSMLFQNAEGQKTRALRLLDGGTEVSSGQLFPVDGQPALRPTQGRTKQHDYRSEVSGN
jgi:hypothetical protein